MLLSLVWFDNWLVAYYLFTPLSRRRGSENARWMAVMRNDVAEFLWFLKLEERSRFLKKAAQKLFLIWACGAETSTAQINKVFLLLFVHKK